MTFVAVLDPETTHSDIFRVDTKTGWGKILTRINNGFYSEMSIGKDRAKITTEAPTDQFVILTLVWDGEKETHQLFVVTGEGKRYDSPEGVAPKEPMDIRSLTFGDAHDEKRNLATGQFLEFLVFDRAIHATEREELEKYYRRKYFKQ